MALTPVTPTPTHFRARLRALRAELEAARSTAPDAVREVLALADAAVDLLEHAEAERDEAVAARNSSHEQYRAIARLAGLATELLQDERRAG